MKILHKVMKSIALALGVLVVTTHSAMATDPVAIGDIAWATGVTSIFTQLLIVLNAVWPAVALIVALFLAVRIVMNLPRRAAK